MEHEGYRVSQVWEDDEGHIPPPPPGGHAQCLPADCGGGGDADLSTRRDLRCLRNESSETVVPVPRVRWLPKGCLDDAATLSGRPPKGLSQGPKRREVPLVLEMRDAGEPKVHWPPEHEGVSGGGQTEAAAGGGGYVGTGPPATVLSAWGSIRSGGGIQIPEAPAGTG